MKIKLFHRQPLPGSTDIVLRDEVQVPYAFQLEVDGLFDAVVRILPQVLANAIARLSSSDSEDEFERRYEEVVTAAMAYVGEGLAASSNRVRIMCPLCGSGPVAIYEGMDGFLYPFGLMKHLTGHQRTYECSVVASARRRASQNVASCTGSSLDG